MPHSGPHFSTFWRVLMPKRMILGPLGAQLGPKWCPKSPKWRQKGLNRVGRAAHIGAQLPGSFSGALLGTLLVDFGPPLAPKSWFSHDLLIYCFARRPELACCFIAKLYQKLEKSSSGLLWRCSWNQFAFKVHVGVLLGTIFVDLGWIWDEFLWILVSFFNAFRFFFFLQ